MTWIADYARYLDHQIWSLWPNTRHVHYSDSTGIYLENKTVHQPETLQHRRSKNKPYRDELGFLVDSRLKYLVDDVSKNVEIDQTVDLVEKFIHRHFSVEVKLAD